jgi:hypothetical protein
VRRTVLLSGDDQANVNAVAAAMGIAEGHGDLLPEAKVAYVRRLVKSGEKVLMVGDGTNDAPALSSATVGIALASGGGGITAEAADAVIWPTTRPAWPTRSRSAPDPASRAAEHLGRARPERRGDGGGQPGLHSADHRRGAAGGIDVAVILMMRCGTAARRPPRRPTPSCSSLRPAARFILILASP